MWLEIVTYWAFAEMAYLQGQFGDVLLPRHGIPEKWPPQDVLLRNQLCLNTGITTLRQEFTN